MSDALLTTAQVISLGDGRLACDFDELSAAVNTLLDENITTIGLLAAGEYLEPYIEKACPWVRYLPPMPELDGMSTDDRVQAVNGWVNNISATHGETHNVPDPSAKWTKRTVIDDLNDMVERINRND